MLEVQHISKRYHYQKVLDDICMCFPTSGIVAIVGPSGCGKTTLLHILGGIDTDFQGDILWENKSVKHHLTRYRRHHVSFIFQQFHLIMWLSVKQNISLPRFFHKQEKASLSLALETLKNQSLHSLSLGQRQRLAYLRSHYHRSDILLCDEPTGSLDPQYAQAVMELLKEESQHRLVILVSHDEKLVSQYSDEVYKMQDGQIIEHICFHETEKIERFPTVQKKYFLCHMRLAFASLCSHKARSFQLMIGLLLSLLSIVLALTLTRHLEGQFHQYIYSLVPASGISFQSRYQQSLSLDLLNQIKNQPGIMKSEMFLDDYECLGIGFQSERYEQSQTLFIGDDTSPYTYLSLKYGNYPQAHHEILLSLSTARHLCGQQDVASLIGQNVYAWYQHDWEVKGICYKIVGITNQTTALDTLYQMDHAYIYLLKDIYQYELEQVSSHLGIVYVHPDYHRDHVMKQLKKQFPDYEFLAIGESTTQNVSQVLNQANIILLFFSLLAILSSLFLIGEVMFLNVIQKKKDLAIMKCFGASSLNIIKIVLYESFQILILTQSICMILYYQLIHMMNIFLENMFESELFSIQVDINIIAFVFIVSDLLVLISQLPPLLYILKMNTVQALKE